MKRILSTSLLAAWNLLAVHAANGTFLAVTFQNGEKVEFALSDTPEITFANDRMTVSTLSTTASYELSTVTTFTYGSTSSGVSQASIARPIEIEADHLSVLGNRNCISVFSLEGKPISLPTTETNGNTTISLSQLPHGVYIIKINNQPIKIARK